MLAATTCARSAPSGTPLFFISNSIAELGTVVEQMEAQKFYLGEELVLAPDATLQKYNQKHGLQVCLLYFCECVVLCVGVIVF